MGRKKDRSRKAQVSYQRPWCYYCDREFDADGILLQHQKARHFLCRVPGCNKRCGTITSLAGHTWHVHHTELAKVPNAIEGRDDTPKNGGYDVVGQMGIPPYVVPPSVRREKEAQEAQERLAAEEALREEEEAAAAAQAAKLAAAQAAQAALAAKSEAVAAHAAADGHKLNGSTAAAKRAASTTAWGGSFAIGGAGGVASTKKAKRTGSGLFSPRPSVADAFDSHNLASDGPSGVDAIDADAEAAAAGAEPAAAGGVPVQQASAEQVLPEEDAEQRQQLLGVVRFYDRAKGFGFITPGGSTGLPEDKPEEDLYVHRSGLVTHGVGELDVGRTVTFVVQIQEDGRKQCVDVRDRHGRPVDDSLLRRQKAAAKYAASDRVPLKYGSDTFVGRKEDNEDRSTSIGGTQDKDLHPGTCFELDFGKWFGVYDGHGGQECAEYVMSKLHVHATEAWQQRGRPTYSGGGGGTPAADRDATLRAGLDGAIEEGFRRTEETFAALAQQKDWDAGSTALVCLVHGRDPPADPTAKRDNDKDKGGSRKGDAAGGALTIVTANLGDCRAVLCRQGAAVRLSEDHKPNRRDEKARIEKAGGHVVEIGGIHRVCTAASKAGLKLVEDDESLYLAVSRAFGDRKLKSLSSTKTSQPLVSATPEISSIALEWEDLFFIIACDGIWDVLSDQTAIEIAAASLSEGAGPQAAAAAVVREAYNQKSLDNLTATVVQFGWHDARSIAAAMAAAEKEKKKAAKRKKKEIAEEEIDMFG